jgi:hypothetical protein
VEGLIKTRIKEKQKILKTDAAGYVKKSGTRLAPQLKISQSANRCTYWRKLNAGHPHTR